MINEIEVPAWETTYHIHQAGEYVFHLREVGCKLTVRGLVKAKGSDHPELKTEVIHHVGGTWADVLIRTLSEDQAAPRFQGLIRIMPGAHGSESYLQHHSLLLGETATSWSLPSLEILADQVKCSHAATLRTLTEDDLFYPRSRGISPEEARELLIQAFLADVIQV